MDDGLDQTTSQGSPSTQREKKRTTRDKGDEAQKDKSADRGKDRRAEDTSQGASGESTNESSRGTSTNSSQTDTQGSTVEPEKPEGHCEVNGSEHRCVPKAPLGWEGPVGLRQGKSTREVSDCPSHDPLVTELFDDVSAAPASCSGCEPVLKLPELSMAKANLFSQSPCEASNLQKAFEFDETRCVNVYQVNDWSAFWSYEPPQALGEVKCGRTPGSAFRPGWEKNTLFRGCQVLREGQCDSPKEVCALRGSGMMCVFREGEHQCPEAYSVTRKVLYKNVSDTRGCGECKGILGKGELQIRGKVSFHADDGCNDTPRHILNYSELEGLCSPNEAQSDKGWLFVKANTDEVSYTGSCTTTPWKSIGGVEPKDPTTLCCKGPG